MRYRAYFDTGSEIKRDTHNITAETGEQLITEIFDVLDRLNTPLLAGQVLEHISVWTPDFPEARVVNLHSDKTVSDSLSGERVKL